MSGQRQEQVPIASHKQACDDTIVEMRRASKEANVMIEILQIDIEKYVADAEKVVKIGMLAQV